MNKAKKFYGTLNCTLIIISVLYGFTALANKQSSNTYQNKNRHHFYNQVGFGSMFTNLNIRDRLDHSSIQFRPFLSVGHQYQLESTNRFRNELEINFNGLVTFHTYNPILKFSSQALINSYYDISILKIQGLYITFGVGAGIKSIHEFDFVTGFKKLLEKPYHKQYYTGIIKLKFGTEYHLTDRFSISNQLHISSNGSDKLVPEEELKLIPNLIHTFTLGTLSVEAYTGFKYIF